MSLTYLVLEDEPLLSSKILLGIFYNLILMI